MAISASVTMTNNISRAGDAVLAGVLRGETLAAERGLALAVNWSPWDQGTLAGSHTVEAAQSVEEGAAVVADTPYAARLHEHPEYDFSTDSNPQARGKWLESAIVEHKAELGDIIRKEARGA